ncbi:transglycosylase SLT domain-containing protein [Rhizobium sp. CB3171]|uniref:transglycosylase SLT domain-containing protein n=1 Tax=unclassified Rhizobium TaxID=2613769 RepID=UPI000CF21ABD|nr:MULTISPECIES: transglycosylase SLT domain-containing protein [Rhizobium]MDK4737995.1 transglycosylase SLT domain-containing protein [Rhizobium sp. CNPSo 3464]UWU23174.1 transglycosylase SLT domain-containing protein [Rhizobium tropici]WFU03891.1 transglycosylase SLT domain-containing protein [Rhizobium sp. CB3171]
MVAIGFPSLKRSVAFSAMMCGVLAGCASTQQQTSQAELPSAQTNVPHPNTNPAPVGAASTTGGVAVASTTPATGQQIQPQQQAALMKSDRVGAGSVAPNQIQAAQDRMVGPVANAPNAANQGTVAIAAVTGAPAAGTSAAAAYAASDEPVVPTVVAIPIPNPARPGDTALLPVSGSATQGQATIPMTSDVAAIQSVVPTPRPGEDAPIMAPAEVAYAAPMQIAGMGYADTRMHYDFNFDASGPTVVSAVLTPQNYDSDVPAEEKSYVSKLIQKYAKLYEIPESLIHRVVHRESRYNPKAYNRGGYFGLMQIRYNTAKSMGYDGPPAGLLDAETNIKYAAKYLRGAWMVADNKAEAKEANAVQLYARGYYYDAKRKGLPDVAQGNY